MILRALTNGSVAGTDTLQVKSGIVGGVLITADGTNAATVIVRRVDSSGKPIIHLVTKIPVWVTGPFLLEGDAVTAYIDISGTGASAQVYEWVS